MTPQRVLRRIRLRANHRISCHAFMCQRVTCVPLAVKGLHQACGNCQQLSDIPVVTLTKPVSGWFVVGLQERPDPIRPDSYSQR